VAACGRRRRVASGRRPVVAGSERAAACGSRRIRLVVGNRHDKSDLSCLFPATSGTWASGAVGLRRWAHVRDAPDVYRLGSVGRRRGVRRVRSGSARSTDPARRSIRCPHRRRALPATVRAGGLGLRGRLAAGLAAARRGNAAASGADRRARCRSAARRGEAAAPDAPGRDTAPGLTARYRPGSPLHWDYGTDAAEPCPLPAAESDLSRELGTTSPTCRANSRDKWCAGRPAVSRGRPRGLPRSAPPPALWTDLVAG